MSQIPNQNKASNWFIPMITGILYIALGVYILSRPLETYLLLSVYFAVSFIFSGIGEIFFAIKNSNRFNGWTWYLVGGIFSTLIGIFILMNPGMGLIILIEFVGFTLLFKSFFMLGYAFDLRQAGKSKWSLVLLAASAGILFSFLLLASPLFTGLTLIGFTALSFILTGAASLIVSFQLRK